jgi:hypothetical protein
VKWAATRIVIKSWFVDLDDVDKTLMINTKQTNLILANLTTQKNINKRNESLNKLANGFIANSKKKQTHTWQKNKFAEAFAI